MKRIIKLLIGTAFLLLLITKIGKAQSYVKTMDDPDETINHMLNIAPVEGFVSGSKYASSSLMLGLNGVYGFTNKIGFEGSAAMPYFNIKDNGISSMCLQE